MPAGLSATALMLKAADIMESRGYNDYTRESHTGGAVCIMGALDLAAGNNPESCLIDTWPVLMEIKDRLAKVVDLREDYNIYNTCATLATWSNNTHSGPTVVSALRRAAALKE